MNKKSLSMIGIAAAGVALSAGAVAFAASDDQSASTTTSQSQTYDKGPGMGGMGETALTGTEAEQVTAAAQAQIPDGTIIRVETDSEGVYEAHMAKADGTEVIVQVDADFKVTEVQEMMGRGMGGHRGGPGMGETPLTGADAEKATAAAQAEIPDGTIIRVETDFDGTYEAHVRKADGAEVEVKMDEDFNVTSVEEHSGMRGMRDSATQDDHATDSDA